MVSLVKFSKPIPLTDIREGGADIHVVSFRCELFVVFMRLAILCFLLSRVFLSQRLTRLTRSKQKIAQGPEL